MLNWKRISQRGLFLSSLSLPLFLGIGLHQEPISAAQDHLESVVMELTMSPDWPLPSEILEKFGDKLPARNPFPNGQSYSQTLSQIRAAAPQFIALIERAYPGATWAPLGRDGFLSGVILDAFYTAIGQKGRVSRLQASGGSYSNLTAQDLAHFVETAGFDFEDAANQPPFVILDRTSYGGYSQSTTTIRAGYHYYKSLGKDPVDLVRKFAVVSFGSNHLLEKTNDLEAFFAEQEEHVRNTASQLSFPAQGYSGIPSTVLGMLAANGVFTDGGEWHYGYGSLRRLSDGRVVGSVGSSHGVAIAQNLLALTYEIMRMTADPQFLLDVQEQARRLGYEFPLTRKFKAEPEDPAERQRRLEELERKKAEAAQAYLRSAENEISGIVAEMAERDEQQKYFSDNALLIAGWLEKTIQNAPDKNAITLMTIQAALYARERNKIGDRDVRRLVAKSIGEADVEDPKFLERIEAMISQNERLHYIFTEKAWGFFTQATKNSEVIGPKFQVIVDRILIPHKCELNLTPPPPKEKKEKRSGDFAAHTLFVHSLAA